MRWDARDCLTTDVYGSSGCGLCESDLLTFSVNCGSDGRGRSFGPWRNAYHHYRYVECPGLPGSRWDLVLARPPVGLQGYTAGLPLHNGSTKMLRGCPRKVSTP